MFTSLRTLITAMQEAGAQRFYAKRLAPNDNSKNQVYLGGGFDALNIIPHGDIETDFSEKAGAVRRRDKASVEFYWIDSQGTWRAPNAQLILYPKYPEVRMSGFLQKAVNAPKGLMASRDEGRVMFFGVSSEGRVLGYVGAHDSDVVAELEAQGEFPSEGVFSNITRLATKASRDPCEVLLETLRNVHGKGWIPGQRLHSDGTIRAYSAQNGGGYTLEAELGIIPNGIAEPDFLGWEIKQYAVRDFVNFRATSPVTLMTPEPTSGVYADDFPLFMNDFGYDDTQGRPHRRNFGGVYRCGAKAHARTSVRMVVEGYDPETGKIDDMGGNILLVARDDRIAAGWEFKNLLNHWNRKHAQAAYLPSISSGNPRQYQYADRVQLGQGTDFFKFMRLISQGSVYLDPAVKVENGKQKKRNQFRVNHSNLPDLYQSFETQQFA
ncbi:MvaI/BcnI family restriction endonuclease [Celeribacter sp. PS-C1]|uniref:MvaI/BcnI family restriction endonuclease n=1 Tax=Celeribacter sp. PS-C1 TaxID=2820813 RepID=UPI001C9323A3|nr:MvaI/BcnI family restriction endonuclease [Celeribacter sp. PS-C1]MBW6419347.1 MvaI/BcnI restriction endonuclease family protein [Celeribacter sp. PS-C1]